MGFLEHPVLRPEVLDDLLLLLIHPASQRHDPKLPGLQDEAHHIPMRPGMHKSRLCLESLPQARERANEPSRKASEAGILVNMSMQDNVADGSCSRSKPGTLTFETEPSTAPRGQAWRPAEIANSGASTK